MRSPESCLLVGPLVALVTACSSPAADPAPPEPTVDEGVVADGLAALYAGDDPAPEDVREGDCFAEELLASTMPATLREGRLLDASYDVADAVPALDADLAGAVADAQLACTDFVADSTAAQLAVTRGSLDERAYAACLHERLDEDDIRAGGCAPAADR